MQKKVTEKEELYEILLLKQKQNLILLTFLSFTSGHLNTPYYYKLETFFLVPRNVTISNKLFAVKLKGL